MKRKIMILMALLLAAFQLQACGGAASSSDTSGVGTSDSANAAESTVSGEEADAGAAGGSLTANADGIYEIYTADDFVAYAQALKDETLALPNDDSRITQSAVLMADIDLSDAFAEDSDLLPLGGPYIVDEDGEETAKTGNFSGTFDGNGHTISGIHMEARTSSVRLSAIGCVGLFYRVGGYRDATGSVCNLTIADSSFTGTTAGAFSANATREAVFENCVTAETVTVAGEEDNSFAGGIVGQTDTCDQVILRSCINRGIVSAGAYVGGIAGVAGDASYFVQCENYGTVTGEDAAGIVGMHGGSSNYGGLVIGCVNYGEVATSDNDRASGIVGENHTTIRFCVNAGHVDGGESGSAFAVSQYESGSIIANGNIGTISGTDIYVYDYQYSWDLGTYEGKTDAELAKIIGYTGEDSESVISIDTSAAADGSLTAILQQNGIYGYWTQGETFPVWDGTGGLED